MSIFTERELADIVHDFISESPVKILLDCDDDLLASEIALTFEDSGSLAPSYDELLDAVELAREEVLDALACIVEQACAPYWRAA